MFDSSVARGTPATFGLDQVIKGWTEGVQLMTVGGENALWISQDLAYKGAPGSPRGIAGVRRGADPDREINSIGRLHHDKPLRL